jgi:radical SAM protein (TIGR01212 family)
MKRYNSYGAWLKKKFGYRVQKVTVDGGFTCPNRDGMLASGGCTYCNNNSFRGWGTTPAKSIDTQIQEGMTYLIRRFKAEKFLIYWQNFSNTYAPVDELEELYSQALESDSRIVGMTIGTRSDCVDSNVLDMISQFSREYYVCMEYGLESIYDRTLEKVNRGHDFANYLDAVKRTQAFGLDVCSHVILGFPWETRSEQLEYPAVLNSLEVNFAKIHHLHVVKGTPMALEFSQRPFRVFEYREWIHLVCDFLERLDSSIVVQRLFGWTPEAAVIAPIWNRTRAEIILDIEREMEKRDSWQGNRL